MAGEINYGNHISGNTSVPRTNQRNYGKVYSPNELAFEQLLKQQYTAKPDTQLQFSKHATARVEQRGIELTQGIMERLQEAVTRARIKGAKDVVVIGEQGAFIVNVPNNTVVTTMSPSEMKDNIFTNIDSAVLM